MKVGTRFEVVRREGKICFRDCRTVMIGGVEHEVDETIHYVVPRDPTKAMEELRTRREAFVQTIRDAQDRISESDALIEALQKEIEIDRTNGVTWDVPDNTGQVRPAPVEGGDPGE